MSLSSNESELMFSLPGLGLLLRLLLKPSISQKMKFSIKYFFSKCDQVRSFLRIWLHLLKKSFMENFIFCAVFAHIKNWIF